MGTFFSIIVISLFQVSSTFASIAVSTNQAQNPLINESQFIEISQKVAALYEPSIKAKGNNLLLRLFWNDSKMAYANNFVPEYKQYEVTISGDYTQTPDLTPDAFSLIVCHEFGHLFGGAPYTNPYRSSNESQADYYSTLKCFKKLVADDYNLLFVLKQGSLITSEMQNQCKQVYSQWESDYYICLRGMLAAETLIRSRNPEANVSISKKDLEKVDYNIFDHYGSPQCRLDSLVAGLLCNAKGNVSNKDYHKGTCTKESGHKFGIRPRCSFNPDSV